MIKNTSSPTSFQEGLVSVVMPAFNADAFIHDAIQSLLQQDYSHWELIVVNDGSTDRTEEVVLNFADARIIYRKQEHRGVSSARNKALEKVRGEFLCFLDADDALPSGSLSARVQFLQSHPDFSFVDGPVILTTGDIANTTRTWRPSFIGNPRSELVRLSDTCFVTISWMVRSAYAQDIRFEESMTHGEDLLFFVEISAKGKYGYVDTPTLDFRRTSTSAMSDIDGLANGYVMMKRFFLTKNLYPSRSDRLFSIIKIMKITFLSYLSIGEVGRAFISVIRIFF